MVEQPAKDRYIVGLQYDEGTKGEVLVKWSIWEVVYNSENNVDCEATFAEEKHIGVFCLLTPNMLNFLSEESYHPNVSKFVPGQIHDMITQCEHRCGGKSQIIQVFIKEDVMHYEQFSDLSLEAITSTALVCHGVPFYFNKQDPISAAKEFYKNPLYVAEEREETPEKSPPTPIQE